MATESRSGRTVRRACALLSLLLLCGGTTAAPLSSEKAYRDARASADRSDLKAALAKTEAALAQLTDANDEWTWALRVLRGEILIKLRNLKEGLPLVERELPPAVRTSEAEVRRQLALGFSTFPDRARTVRYFERAMEVAAAHQPRLVFDVHLAFGNVLPFAEAESHLNAALDLARKRGNELGIANANNALSRLCTNEQLYARAVEAGEEANAIYARLGVAGRVSAASGNLGWAYLELGDYEAAADLFRRAEAAAKTAGLAPERVTWLNQLGNIEFVGRRYVEAEGYYRAALDLARTIDYPEIGAPLTNLARVAIETGRFDDARRYNDEALEQKKHPGNQQSARIVDARIAMLTGDSSRAEQTLRRVIQTADHPAMKWEAEAWLAQLYARLARNAEAGAKFRQAVNTVGAARKAINDRELRLAFFNLADAVIDSYVDFLIRNRRVYEALAVTETIRAQTLEEGLAAATLVRALDPRAIAKESGATILSYWLGRDRSFLWVVTPAEVVVHALPPDASIESEVERYRRDLEKTRPTLQLSGARGEGLYRMLAHPASRAIAKGSRVIVIPDGRLHALNFETLVVSSPRRYWIEDVIVANASSLQLLTRERAAHSTAPAMLLVGDPPAPEFPPLPRAGEEIASIARHFPKRTVLSGKNATPIAYVRAAPEKFDYVHFVAHGMATRKRPLDSAVILARDANGQKLFARDIVRLRLRARLVTISSCHGAGTRTFSGEGLVGLAWAFLGAGAEQVIAALWEVNDSATPELMDRMYAGIRAGRDPAVALRDAKLTLLRGKGPWKKAVYWAPFVLYSGS